MSNKGDKTRQRILDAANTLFCQRDYDGASISDIAKQAEVKKASVFYHFGTKEELFKQVVADFYHEQDELFKKAGSIPGTIRERLHRMVEAYLEYSEQKWQLVSLIQRLTGSRHPMSKYVSPEVDPVVVWLRENIAYKIPADGKNGFYHMYVTFVGAISQYYTHATVFQRYWHNEPMSPRGLQERRNHIHWLMDKMLEDFDID